MSLDGRFDRLEYQSDPRGETVSRRPGPPGPGASAEPGRRRRFL